ncbi:RNA polymerase sigma factor [Bremerella sp. P1]|uniref:RNA polymerase sigma factor n=1 Tax=Bremerella sp. P1 TaxID=3026424 RepID=UPI00236895DE|nr:sigma-70 family RNA polymerase sigma factor [Bremerella sp. P1]WDI43752.1 sigma-70 family RNA polymerase sigma factor [Bremerella sp. P1]
MPLVGVVALTKLAAATKENHSCPHSSGSTNEDNLDWTLITSRLAEGDERSFRIFYDLVFEPMLQTIKQRSGRDDATSLDILQTAMIKVLGSIRPLNNRSAVLAWSRTVAKTVTYDYLRKQARSREVFMDLLDISREGDLRQCEDDWERLQWIEEELQELPEELRQIVSFRYRMGWSLARIGERLGLATGAVDGRIRRAIKRLRIRANRAFHDNF